MIAIMTTTTATINAGKLADCIKDVLVGLLRVLPASLLVLTVGVCVGVVDATGVSEAVDVLDACADVEGVDDGGAETDADVDGTALSEGDGLALAVVV